MSLTPASDRVRDAYRFDQARLEAWMRQHVPGFDGPIAVEQFIGGQSNPTYQIKSPGRTYVMRRKPPGPLLKGAHAIDREARVQLALSAAGFPVPRIYSLCMDASIVGTPFYVMEWVDGRIVWDATFPEATREERPKYFEALTEVLARLHRLDHRAMGLGDYGRSGNYFERQIARWSRQYREEIADAGAHPQMDRLIDWLSAHIPAGDETSLVHGDFRVDNVIFHPNEPRVIAVLDWELSTLGHPLADFCYYLMMYRLPPKIVAGLCGAPLQELNIPAEADCVADYCRRTGRAGITHLDFYVVFNMFRLAAICHGIKGRLARGTATSARAVDYAAGVGWLADLAWRQVSPSWT